MTPEDFIKEFRKQQETKRQAVKPTHRHTEKPPTCICGMAMIRRFGHGPYYCPICNTYAREL